MICVSLARVARDITIAAALSVLGLCLPMERVMADTPTRVVRVEEDWELVVASLLVHLWRCLGHLLETENCF